MLCFGIHQICTQYYRMNKYKPIEAKILKTEIAMRKFHRRGGTDYIYIPLVRYEYQVEGKSYVSDNVTMIAHSRSDKKWAENIEANYIIGSVKTAYYNPRKPEKAFLIKEFKFDVYAIFMGGVFLLCTTISIYMHLSKKYGIPVSPQIISQEEYSVTPYSVYSEYWKTLFFSAFYYTFGLFSAGHYFVFAGKPYNTFPQIYTAIYLSLGLIPLSIMGYKLLQYRLFEESRVFVNSDDFRVGDKIQIQIRQKFKSKLHIEDTSVSLVYAQHMEQKDKRDRDVIKVFPHYQDQVTIIKDYTIMPGEQISFEGQLNIPQGRNPTGFSDKDKSFPYFEWYIEVWIKLQNRQDYKVKFPIEVKQ